MKRYTLLMFFCGMIVISSAQGQSYRSTVNEGNERYNQQQYDGAREKYEQAAVSEPERPESYFNHGNAAYRAEDIKSALEQYEKAGTRVRSKEELSRTLYNAGNTFLYAAEKGTENPVLQKAAGEQAGDLRMEGYKKAIDLYKQTLKLNPQDSDARYNLTYAKKKLEELQKQQQNQDKDQKKDQKDEKDKDQDKKDKNKQDEQQKKDQQDEKDQKQENQKDNDQKQDAKKNEQQKSKPEKQKNMSKQQAEQILRALERDEKELQKKKRQKSNVRVSVEKDW